MVVSPGASADAAEPARPSADDVLRATTEEATEGFMIVGVDGIIRSANRAMSRMTGYSHQELVGSSAWMLNAPGDEAVSERAFDALTRDGTTEWRRRREYRRKDGSSFWAEVLAYPVKGSDGTVLALAGHIVPAISDQTWHEIADSAEAEELRPRVFPRVGHLRVSRAGTIEEVNTDLCELLGWQATNLLGMPSSDFRHPDDVGLVEAALAGLVAGADGAQWTARYRKGDGSYLWGDVRATAVRGDDGGLVGAHASMMDASESVQRQHDRALADGLLIEATERAPIGQALMTLDGYFAQVNASFCAITGYERSELTKLTYQSITHPADLETDVEQAAAVVNGSIPSYEMDKRYFRRDGSIVWVRLYVSAIRDDQGEPLAFVSQVIDISRQKTAEIATTAAHADLSYRSVHDALTGLPNREAIHESLSAAIAGQPSDGRVAVMFIDVDRFKSVNDGISHISGDRVLVGIAQRLSECLETGDMVGRFGGDEFVVVANRTASDRSVVESAESIRSIISGSDISLDSDRGIHVTVSIGISVGRAESTPEEMLSEADTAMYQAKSRGRDCCVVADDHMRNEVQSRMELAGSIRNGIAHREFVPWFQPIVEFSSERIVGFESLARWVCDGRTITAADFIEVAEEAGSIKALGSQIFARTVELMGTLGAGYLMTVNASPTEIADPAFSPMVSQLLRDHCVDPTQLAIEITEHALMNLGVEAHRGLLTLSDSGVGLLVDDFGTGYSSISTLLKYPVTGIKLDLSFTSRIGQNPKGQAAKIAGGLADLADRLNLTRIAEGIESEQQARALQELGWTWGQGWLFGRAAPASHSIPRPRAESPTLDPPVDVGGLAD